MDAINLAQSFASFDEPWSPRLIGELNGQHVRIAKFDGAYVWHSHANEDELFLVVDGAIDIELRDRTIHLEAGEMFIVPRGVEHRPVARERANVMLFEPASVRPTGDVDDPRSIEPEDIRRV